MPHRFNHLAKKYVTPLWECVQATITDLKDWLENCADEVSRIGRALRNAEDIARDALVRMAKELMVFPAKPRTAGEGFVSVPIPPKADTRPPVFRLGLERLEESAGWVEQSDTHQAEVQQETPPVGIAKLNPPYTDIEIFERRLLALEDVLTEPGKHAARMKRALHKREDDSGDPIILKDSDTVLLDHIDRFVDDAAYSNTEAFRQLHEQFFDSS